MGVGCFVALQLDGETGRRVWVDGCIIQDAVAYSTYVHVLIIEACEVSLEIRIERSRDKGNYHHGYIR